MCSLTAKASLVKLGSAGRVVALNTPLLPSALRPSRGDSPASGMEPVQHAEFCYAVEAPASYESHPPPYQLACWLVAVGHDSEVPTW